MNRPCAELPVETLPSRQLPAPWRLVGLLLIALGVWPAVHGVRAWIEDRHPHDVRGLKHFNAPFITSPSPIVDRMLELAELDAQDVVFDLGCGDGRILVAAAKRYGCYGVGYEYDEHIAAEARENVRRNHVEHLVKIQQQDIFTIDRKELEQASVITLYLLPWMNEKLLPQLAELGPGKIIVSHEWDLPGVKPDKVVLLDPRDEEMPGEHAIYVWKTPLKVN